MMRTTRAKGVLWIYGGFFFGGCTSPPSPPPAPERPLIVDAHTHIAPSELDRLHEILDEVGVDWVLNLSGMWPSGPLERQLKAARESGRILVATTLPWRAVARPDFPKLCALLIERAAQLGASAVKIEKALGLGVRNPQGELLSVDDEWLDPIWETAGRFGLPVVIHTADPAAFWKPVDETNERYEELTAHPRWSNHGRDVPSFEALLEQLMRVVARHPNTIFVSVHFGNRAEDPFWVSEQLDRYPNLFVDLAARLPEVGRHDPEQLRALFIRHSSRILFGTDLGVSPDDFLMLGSYGETPNERTEVGPYFKAHWRWLETRDRMPSPTPIQGNWDIHGLGLPPEITRKIYFENATRLFGPAPPKAKFRWRPPYFRTSFSASP